MSAQLLRTVVRSARVPHQRSISSTAVRRQDVALDQALKDKIHPKVGNRDIVGWGFNGCASYVDRPEFPCPAIRFKENSADVMTLREKEKGDWSKLTLEEKKALYRSSFCQTYAEMKAPTGEWKSVLSAVLLALSATAWIVMWMKKYVYPPMPSTITREWQEAQVERMLAQGQGRIEGISSSYDYEKGEFK
ncbi:cytochrome c oxidase subunit 4 isoform 1, mitochondrial-like [Haliotis rubra]|uniref:cytochrome c oxidase subunit 4 isoform 1, mitochondrial-like n=1 Tax=Haliotis rubra TaxID=36100 RepID=UPI001EE5D9AC|nr:cytochrome c oxidase subunit 4 isoform 1, mitochondrial-like [Haliotis rubra]